MRTKTFKSLRPGGPGGPLPHVHAVTDGGRVFAPTCDFCKNKKNHNNRLLTPSKSVENHLKLSFPNAAFNPQEIVHRSQSYEGFMPIFGSAG